MASPPLRGGGSKGRSSRASSLASLDHFPVASKTIEIAGTSSRQQENDGSESFGSVANIGQHELRQGTLQKAGAAVSMESFMQKDLYEKLEESWGHESGERLKQSASLVTGTGAGAGGASASRLPGSVAFLRGGQHNYNPSLGASGGSTAAVPLVLRGASGNGAGNVAEASATYDDSFFDDDSESLDEANIGDHAQGLQGRRAPPNAGTDKVKIFGQSKPQAQADRQQDGNANDQDENRNAEAEKTKIRRPPQILIHAVVEDVLKSPMFRELPMLDGTRYVGVDETEADKVGVLLGSPKARSPKRDKLARQRQQMRDQLLADSGTGSGTDGAVGRHPHLLQSVHEENAMLGSRSGSKQMTNRGDDLEFHSPMKSSYSSTHFVSPAKTPTRLPSLTEIAGSPYKKLSPQKASWTSSTSAHKFSTPTSQDRDGRIRAEEFSKTFHASPTGEMKTKKQKSLYSPALSPSRRGPGTSILLQSPAYRGLGNFPAHPRANCPSYCSPERKDAVLRGLEEKRQERKAASMARSFQEEETHKKAKKMSQSVSVFQRVPRHDLGDDPSSPPPTVPQFRRCSKDFPAAQLYADSVNRDQTNARGQITPWFSPEGRKTHKDLSLSFLPDRDYADTTAIKNETPKKFSLLSQLRHAKAAKGSLLNSTGGGLGSELGVVSSTPVFSQIEFLLQQLCQTGVGAASPAIGYRRKQSGSGSVEGSQTASSTGSLMAGASSFFLPSSLAGTRAYRSGHIPTLAPPAEGRYITPFDHLSDYENRDPLQSPEPKKLDSRRSKQRPGSKNRSGSAAALNRPSGPRRPGSSVDPSNPADESESTLAELHRTVLRERELLLLKKVLALYAFSTSKGFSCWEMYCSRSLWARFCLDCGLVHEHVAPYHWVLQVFDQYASPCRQWTLHLETTSLKQIEDSYAAKNTVGRRRKEEASGDEEGSEDEDSTSRAVEQGAGKSKKKGAAALAAKLKMRGRAGSKDSLRLESVSPVKSSSKQVGGGGEPRASSSRRGSLTSGNKNLMARSASVLMGASAAPKLSGDAKNNLPTLLASAGSAAASPEKNATSSSVGGGDKGGLRGWSKSKSMSAVEIAAELLKSAERADGRMDATLRGGQQFRERSPDRHPRPTNVYMRLFHKKKRALQERRKRKALEREMKQERKKIEQQKKVLLQAMQQGGAAGGKAGDALGEEIAKLNLLLAGNTPQFFPIAVDSDASDDDLQAGGLSLQGPQVLYPGSFAKAVIHVARQFYPTHQELRSAFFELELEENSSDDDQRTASKRGSNASQPRRESRGNSIISGSGAGAAVVASGEEANRTGDRSATSFYAGEVGAAGGRGPRLLRAEESVPQNGLISKIFFADEVLQDESLLATLRGGGISLPTASGMRLLSPARKDHEDKLKLALETNKKTLWRNRRVRNCFLEPEVIHLVCVYLELFQTLFNSYRDADKDDSSIPLDNFCQMCEDYELIPAFGSRHAFESAYRNSECAEEPESPRNEVTKQLKASPPTVPERIPAKLQTFVEWSAQQKALERFNGDQLWQFLFGNRVGVVDFAKFEAAGASPALEPRLSGRRLVQYWKALVSYKVNKECGQPGTVFEQGMVMADQTGNSNAPNKGGSGRGGGSMIGSRPGSKESGGVGGTGTGSSGTSLVVVNSGDGANALAKKPRRRASVDSAMLKDAPSIASLDTSPVSGGLLGGRSNASRRGRRPSKQEPVVAVLPEGKLTEFLDKTTFCAVMDPLLRDFKLKNAALFRELQNAGNRGDGDKSSKESSGGKEKTPKRRASTGEMPASPGTGRRGSVGDAFAQQRRGSASSANLQLDPSVSQLPSAARRGSADGVSHSATAHPGGQQNGRMSVGQVVKTISAVSRARSSLRNSIRNGGEEQGLSDLDESSEDEFERLGDDPVPPPPPRGFAPIGGAGGLTFADDDGTANRPRDKTDPEIFRAFLKKRFSTLSRAWNWMCGKNQGRAFASWSEVQQVMGPKYMNTNAAKGTASGPGSPTLLAASSSSFFSAQGGFGGGGSLGGENLSCRTDNSRTFTYQEFEDILIEKLKYTNERSIVEALFRNLDDDDSRSISIEEIRPVRKTNFFLPAFIESLLKTVFATLSNSGHPIMAGGMTYLKLLVFLTHLRKTVEKKATELTPANVRKLTSEIISPAFDPAVVGESSDEESEELDGSDEAGSQENDGPAGGFVDEVARVKAKWGKEKKHKVTDKYFRRDPEFKKWATEKEKDYAVSKVTRLQASVAKLRNFNWLDPPMTDKRLTADPSSNHRLPAAIQHEFSRLKDAQEKLQLAAAQDGTSLQIDAKHASAVYSPNSPDSPQNLTQQAASRNTAMTSGTLTSGGDTATSPEGTDGVPQITRDLVIAKGTRGSTRAVCQWCNFEVSRAGWGNAFCLVCSCTTEAVSRGVYPLLPLFRSNCRASPLFTEQIVPQRGDIGRLQSMPKPRI